MKDKVSKEELYELITNHSFATVGSMLGIGKTTVVRWCIQYELPSTKAELDNIRFINKLNLVSPTINVIGKYTKAREPVHVKCTVCSYEWTPTPDSLLQGHGCSRCNCNRHLSEDMLQTRIDEVHNGRIVVIGLYKGMLENTAMQCMVCDHVWEPKPNNIIRAENGCPECYRLSISGSNSPLWNPDLTEDERKDRRREEGDIAWRREVYAKDNYACVKCKKTGSINAHHIFNYKDYPDKRRDVTNGITLCTDCHKEFHSLYGRRFNNDEQLREFLQEEKNA